MPDEEERSGEQPPNTTTTLSTVTTSAGSIGGASSSTSNDVTEAHRESSTATTTENNTEVADNSKKRAHSSDNKNADNEGGDGRNKKKSKKYRSYNNNKRSNKKDRKKNHTWREENNKSNNRSKNNEKRIESEGYVRNFGSSKTEVHAGSYANPKQRELFNVTLPPHLIPPIIGDSDEKKEEYKDNSGEGGGQQRNFVKRKVAFMLAYLGTGYSGFQANEGQKTLQGEFELALLKCGLLSPLNMGFYHKYGWSTSGRTDKGVHAAAQVCSAKIQLEGDDNEKTLDDVRNKLNQQLPDHFRVLDVTKTTKKFCAKTGRSRVRYQYMIPAFCLRNRKEMRDLMNNVAPVTAEGRVPGEPLTKKECNEIKQLVKDYRVSTEQLEALQTALHKYEGTHSFHNFTNKLTSKDANATRYMMSFNVEEPMIFDDGTQWIPTQVVGQSFLIHQIRKMVSVAVDSVRLKELGVGPDLVDKILDKNNDTCRTDLAPAQGLFMEMSFYDGYNERLPKIQNNNLQTAGVKELKWHDEKTEVYQRWKKFRDEVLMDHIVREENREGNFLQHLYNHEFYFDHEEYYGLAGHNDNANKAAEDDGDAKEKEEGSSN